MKTFKNIREASKTPEGVKVFSKKISKINVVVQQEKKGFTVYIDGDKLDTYRSQKEAEKMGVAFAKEM